MPLPDGDVTTSDKLIMEGGGSMARLLAIMRRLRDPETGCPWDIAQDFASIAPYTIEEAHEVADAIERQAWGELQGELGDLLLQTVYHAQMADEAGLFGFDDVVRAISDKMVARHPHVFGDESRDKTRRSADRGLGADQGRRARACAGAGRRGAGAACADAGGEAAEARGAGGVRLAVDR